MPLRADRMHTLTKNVFFTFPACVIIIPIFNATM